MINPFHLTIDLKECNTHSLKSKEHIRGYIEGVCRNLKLVRIDEPVIYQFPGEGGITASQILGESLLSLHSYPEHNCIYIDIFSCSKFNITLAVNYSQMYFGAKDAKINKVARMRLVSDHTNHFKNELI